MDVFLNPEKYNIDQKAIEEQLKKEMDELVIDENDNDLNLSRTSNYFETYAKEQMQRWNHDKKEMEKQFEKQQKENYDNFEQRDKMFEEMEQQIKKLKQLTNNEIFEDEDYPTNNLDQSQKMKILQKALKEDQIQQIKKDVQFQFQNNKQEYIFAEDEVERKFKEKNVLLDESINSEEYQQELLDIMKNSQNIQSNIDTLDCASTFNKNNFLQDDQNILNTEINQSTSIQNQKPKSNSQPINNTIKNQSKQHNPQKKNISSSKIIGQSSFIQNMTELDLRKERMQIEQEQMLMEKEDLTSFEYEDFMHKQKFKQKDWILPDFKQYSDNEVKVFSLQFEHPQIDCFGPIEVLKVTEQNLAPRNSKDICLEHLKEVAQLQKQMHSQNKQKNSSKQKKIDIQILKIDRSVLKTKNSQPQVHQIEFEQKKFEYSFKRKLDIYFQKISNTQKQLLKDQLGLMQTIKQITDNYKPRFLDTYFEDNEYQSYNELDQNDDNANRSLDHFLQDNWLNDYSKSSKLQIKLEKIQDLQGIQKLINLKTLILSVNKITEIDLIHTCKLLIEVNLSQNFISDYSALGNLSELRLLNLELNRVQTMSKLTNCKNLEVMNLSNNAIEQIDNLEHCQKLKRLSLFKNKILKIEKLDNLIFLEELDIGNNKIKRIENLHKNLLLRKLILYNNQIENIPPNFSFLFLNELYLNNNKIKDIQGLSFLPCLEYLNLRSNEIQGGIEDSNLIVLPNLTKVLIGYNKLQSFAQLWNLIKFSPKLKKIEYQENEFLKNISANVLELYEYLIIRKMQGLQEINSSELDIGHKKYLSVKFDNFLVKNLREQIPGNAQQEFAGFMNRYMMITKEYQFINSLESKVSNKDKRIPFTQTILYFTHKNKSGPLHYMNLYHEKLTNIKCYGMNIFSQKDFYDNKYEKSMKKIKNFLIKTIYKKRKFKKFLIKNIKKVLKIQSLFRGVMIRKRVNMKSVLNNFRFKNKAVFAIKIQKVFRGFKLRKKFKKLFKNIKYDIDDLEEFVDDEWLQNEPEFDTGLKIPDNFDINAFIMPSNQLMYQNINMNQNNQHNNKLPPLQQNHNNNNQQQQNQKTTTKQHTQHSHHNEEYKQSKNIYDKADSVSGDQFGATSQYTQFKQSNLSDFNKSNKDSQLRQQHHQQQQPSYKITQQEKEQIKDDWGFTKPDVAEAFAFRLEKKRKLQFNAKKKQLTATEKYQKLMQNKK